MEGKTARGPAEVIQQGVGNGSAESLQSMHSRVGQPGVKSCPLLRGAPYLAPHCQDYVAWGRLLNVSVKRGLKTYLLCNLCETVSGTETKFSKAPEVQFGLLLLDRHCASSFKLLTFLWTSSIQL